MPTANPRLTPLLRVFMVVVLLVLAAGVSLFLLPDLVGPRWPWRLTPFNTRFLGAFYLSELVAIVTLLVVNRWAPARLVLPMASLFTALVSGVSLLYLDRFDPGRPVTWI